MQENIVYSDGSKFASTTYARVLGAITLILISGVPYATGKGTLPLDAVAWETEDGRTRVVVVAAAFALAALGIAVALIATALALLPDAKRLYLWALWSLASAAHALGVACYPVWLNGVAAASSGELVNELDPKRVAPFVWLRGWFDYPEGFLAWGLLATIVFTPFVAAHLIIASIHRQWSWNLAAEAALPLAWIGLHQPMLLAFAWSLD